MNMSILGKQSVRIISHWALILALLLGQSIALGHDHDADSHSSEVCALCIHAQQSVNALPSPTVGLPVRTSPVCISATQWQRPVAVIVLPFQSRAPPFTPL
jgi:hypothetical protein